MLTILLPSLAVITVVLVLGCLYWYIPWSQDQALREEWRQEEATAKRLEILEEFEEKLKTVKTKAEKFEALAEIGFSRYTLDDYQGAVKYWQKALELEPKASITWYNLGNAYKSLENFPQAEAYFKEAINSEFVGATPLFYKALADLYWYKIPEKKGDITSVYMIGLVKDPKNIELIGALGSYYEKIGNKDMAYKQYLKILNIDPTSQYAVEKIKTLWEEE